MSPSVLRPLRRALLTLAALWCALSPTHGLAQADSGPIPASLEELVPWAHALWDARAGVGQQVELAAIGQAAAGQGGRMTDLLLMPVPGVGIHPDVPDSGDNYLTVVARFEGRRLQPLREQVFHALQNSVALSGRQDALRYILAITDAWLALWQASALVEHLEQDRTEIEALVAEWSGADTAGFLTATDRAEWSAEVARIDMELQEARWLQQDAALALQALSQISDLPQVAANQLVVHTQQSAWGTLGDPWARLEQSLDRLPTLQSSLATADLMEANASLIARSAPTIVGVGTEIHDNWIGQFYVAAVVEVTVPLAHRHRADAAIEQARAQRLRQSTQLELQQSRVDIQAERERWLRRVQHLDALDDGWLLTLRQRLQAWEAAARGGRPNVAAWVAAYTELHEAEHLRFVEQLAMDAEYWLAWALVQALEELEQ